MTVTIGGDWLQVKFPTSKTIVSFALNCPDWGGGQGSVTAWTIVGSSDGTDWHYVDSRSGSPYTNYWNWQTFTFTNTTSYLYYRFVLQQGNVWYGMIGIGGIGFGDASGTFYPPTLSSSTALGYETTETGSWYSNGSGYTNWYYLTQQQVNTYAAVSTYLNTSSTYGGFSYSGSNFTTYSPAVVDGPPNAPDSLTTVHHNEYILVNFTPGASNSHDILNYSYALSTDNVTFSSFTEFSPATGAVNNVTITGLTNGTRYYIKLKAINSLGSSPASATVYDTPSTTASRPHDMTTANGDGQLTLNFSPGYNGGSPILNYEYAISTDDSTFSSFTAFSPATGTVSSVTVTGLTNGTQYFIKLREITIDGAGEESVSVAGVPSTTPDPPTNITWVDTYNGTISVSFTPGNDQGATITNYVYSLDGGNTWTILNPEDGVSPITITGLTNRTHYTLELKAMNSNGAVSASEPLALYYMCFLEGTKITCYDASTQQEVERSIETLRKGDLVKTTMDGYKAIDCIGTSKIYNPANSMRSKNRLYRCSKENYPELKEDLVITGCHAVLVSDLTDEQRRELIDIQGKVYVTEDYYRLIACVDKRAVPYEKEGLFNIWHFALENDNYYFNYGVFANGLKVETASKRMMKEMSGMDLM